MPDEESARGMLDEHASPASDPSRYPAGARRVWATELPAVYPNAIRERLTRLVAVQEPEAATKEY